MRNREYKYRLSYLIAELIHVRFLDWFEEKTEHRLPPKLWSTLGRQLNQLTDKLGNRLREKLGDD